MECVDVLMFILIDEFCDKCCVTFWVKLLKELIFDLFFALFEYFSYMLIEEELIGRIVLIH